MKLRLPDLSFSLQSSRLEEVGISRRSQGEGGATDLSRRPAARESCARVRPASSSDRLGGLFPLRGNDEDDDSRTALSGIRNSGTRSLALRSRANHAAVAVGGGDDRYDRDSDGRTVRGGTGAGQNVVHQKPAGLPRDQERSLRGLHGAVLLRDRSEGRGGAESSRRERFAGERTPRDLNVGAASRGSENRGYNHGVKGGFTRIPRAREGRLNERLQLGWPAFQSVYGESRCTQRSVTSRRRSR